MKEILYMVLGGIIMAVLIVNPIILILLAMALIVFIYKVFFD